MRFTKKQRSKFLPGFTSRKMSRCTCEDGTHAANGALRSKKQSTKSDYGRWGLDHKEWLVTLSAINQECPDRLVLFNCHLH